MKMSLLLGLLVLPLSLMQYANAADMNHCLWIKGTAEVISSGAGMTEDACKYLCKAKNSPGICRFVLKGGTAQEAKFGTGPGIKTDFPLEAYNCVTGSLTITNPIKGLAFTTNNLTQAQKQCKKSAQDALSTAKSGKYPIKFKKGTQETELATFYKADVTFRKNATETTDSTEALIKDTDDFAKACLSNKYADYSFVKVTLEGVEKCQSSRHKKASCQLLQDSKIMMQELKPTVTRDQKSCTDFCNKYIKNNKAKLFLAKNIQPCSAKIESTYICKWDNGTGSSTGNTEFKLTHGCWR